MSGSKRELKKIAKHGVKRDEITTQRLREREVDEKIVILDSEIDTYLAEQAGLSQYHFIRTFKKETGFTPHEYLVNTRLATARYLLKNTRLPVKDICFNTGFSCESVFCSAFKQHQGMTPAQYRALEQ